MYKIDLYYGYGYSPEEGCLTTFYPVDPETSPPVNIPMQLAADLDMTDDDPDFGWDIRSVEIPETVVQQIISDYLREEEMKRMNAMKYTAEFTVRNGGFQIAKAKDMGELLKVLSDRGFEFTLDRQSDVITWDINHDSGRYVGRHITVYKGERTMTEYTSM